MVNSKRISRVCGVVAIRLNPGNDSVRDLVLIRQMRKCTWGFYLSDELIERTGTICPSATEVAGAIMAALP